MKTLFKMLTFTNLLAIGFLTNAAQNCADALVPTIEQMQSNYSMVQSYMKLYASEEYDRLKALDQASVGADASYKLFSAEYKSSNTKEDFREKINKRLSQENYSASESEAKAGYRRFLSDAQLSAWKACVVAQSIQGGAGAFELFVRSVSENLLVLQMDWIPGRGEGSTNGIVQITNGKINGKSTYNLSFSGVDSKVISIYPDPGAKNITVVANVKGRGDTISIDMVKPSKIDLVSRVIACSGNVCQSGDWPIGTAFPTPWGDCDVQLQILELDATRRIKNITFLGYQKLAGGDPEDISITKMEMHPSAYIDSSVRRTLKLCGYSKDRTDRRAVVKLGFEYE